MFDCGKSFSMDEIIPLFSSQYNDMEILGTEL